MKKAFLTISCALLTTLALAQSMTVTSPDSHLFDQLITFMQGSFSSEEQALADTNYMHITLDMYRIWNNDASGAWLYVEQTAAWTPGKPYRQRVYRVVQTSENTFTSTIMKMPNPERFIGGHLNPIVFDSLPKDSLEVLPGCALQLTFDNGVFAGATNEGECLNAWGKAVYATSEVSVHPSHMVSWDRGWNADKEQVWGATEGGYIFKKVLPEITD